MSGLKDGEPGEEEPTCNLLKAPLRLADLMGNGASFEINTDFDEGMCNDIHDEIFDSDEDENNKLDDSKLISPWQKPFDELKQQMTKINDFIFKRVTVHGNVKAGLMPENSRVSINYNGFWEREGAPFDSSFLRGSKFSFYTGQSGVLEGLELAARSMYLGEQAQFIISYKLLYGEMGCPPRIRPKSDALFVIEMIDFNDVGNLEAINEVPAEDRNKFSIVGPAAKEAKIKGNDFFKQGMYKYAAGAFEKAIHKLNFCRLENEEEERDQRELLILLHTNLAVSYNKLKLFSRTLLMTNEIKRLTGNQPTCKVYFQEGRALLEMGEYGKAKTALIKAQRLEPKNVEITAELEKLEKRQKTYSENEKSIWQRALGSDKDKKINKTDVVEEISEFEKNMLVVLNDFKNCSLQNKFKFPAGLSKEELNTIEKIAEGLELNLETNSDETYTIRKK